MVQRAPEVVTDFRPAGLLVEARVEAGLVDPIVAQRQRVHPIESRWLVESDERIGIVPVPARRVTAIGQHHRRVRVGDQRVGECHARGSGSDYQVVSVDRIQ